MPVIARIRGRRRFWRFRKRREVCGCDHQRRINSLLNRRSGGFGVVVVVEEIIGNQEKNKREANSQAKTPYDSGRT